MKNKIILFFILFTFFASLIYFALCFIFATLDVSKMDLGGKTIGVLFFILANVFSGIAIFANEFKNKLL